MIVRILFVCVGIMLVAWSVTVAMVTWRGLSDDLPAMGLGFLLGNQNLRRGIARSVVARVVLMVSMTLLVAASGSGPDHSSWLAALDWVGGVGVILSLTLHLSIVLIARPAWLIPPSMRSDKGMLFRDRRL